MSLNRIPSDTPVFDKKSCLHLANHKEELATTIFKMFCDMLPEHLATINAAVEEKNWKNAGDELHKLSGGCSYAGAARIKWVIKEVEKNINEAQFGESTIDLIKLLNTEAKKFLQTDFSAPLKN